MKFLIGTVIATLLFLLGAQYVGGLLDQIDRLTYEKKSVAITCENTLTSMRADYALKNEILNYCVEQFKRCENEKEQGVDQR